MNSYADEMVPNIITVYHKHTYVKAINRAKISNTHNSNKFDFSSSLYLFPMVSNSNSSSRSSSVDNSTSTSSSSLNKGGRRKGTNIGNKRPVQRTSSSLTTRKNKKSKSSTTLVPISTRSKSKRNGTQTDVSTPLLPLHKVKRAQNNKKGHDISPGGQVGTTRNRSEECEDVEVDDIDAEDRHQSAYDSADNEDDKYGDSSQDVDTETREPSAVNQNIDDYVDTSSDDEGDRQMNDDSGIVTRKDSMLLMQQKNRELTMKLKEMEKDRQQRKSRRQNSCIVDLFLDTSTVGAQNIHAVKAVVKNFMFPRQKFVNDNELRDLTKDNALPHRLMDQMGWSRKGRIDKWAEVGIVVKRHLDKLRSSRTTSMRKQYNKIGECLVCFSE